MKTLWLLFIMWNVGDEWVSMPPPTTLAECRAAGRAHVRYGHGAPIVWECVRVYHTRKEKLDGSGRL